MTERRTEVVSVRFTTEEREQLGRAAEISEMTVVAWMRSTAADFARFTVDDHAAPLRRYTLVSEPESHDEAIERAAELVSESLIRCSPELREKFYRLVRDLGMNDPLLREVMEHRR